MKFLQNCNSKLWIYPLCTIFFYFIFLSAIEISEHIPVKWEMFKKIIFFSFCRILVFTASLFPVVGITEVLFHITKLKVINSIFLFITNILLFICFIVFGGFIFIVYALAPLDAIKATPDILFQPIIISGIAFVIYLAGRILWIIKK